MLKWFGLFLSGAKGRFKRLGAYPGPGCRPSVQGVRDPV